MSDSFSKNEVMVSICCMTYQHANYIRQCLDGFVAQKTNFGIEIIVHDDASEDGTAEIVKEFETAHQELFKCVYQTENQFKKQNSFFKVMLPMCSGKYIAYCEGDDYWTDPLKLQKQVDLLESHPGSSFSFSKVELLFEKELPTHSYQNMDHYPSVIPISDYLDNYYPIPMLTKVFRRSYLKNYNDDDWAWLKQVRFTDNVLHMIDLMQGPALFLNEVTGVYRIQSQSITRLAPKDGAWHINEILLTHAHFVDLAPKEFKDKFIAIRMFHFEKLLDSSIATKKPLWFLSSAIRYLMDSKSGTVSQKFESIGKTLKKHLTARKAS